MRVARAVGIIALLSSLVVGAIVRVHPFPALDLSVQRWVLTHQHPAAERTFHWITVLGGITGMRVIAVLGAIPLVRRRRWLSAAAPALVVLLAVPYFNLLKRLYDRPRPAGLGAGIERDAAFPSGHALTSAAVCCAIAWALRRNGLIGRGPAFALALVPPLFVGLSRIYLNVHWSTDVIGGWCAGVVIAMLVAALEDRLRRSSTGESKPDAAHRMTR